jgi:hypothetical protein
MVHGAQLGAVRGVFDEILRRCSQRRKMKFAGRFICELQVEPPHAFS